MPEDLPDMSVCTSILKGIQHFYDASRYTDAIVEVEEQSFHCHKIVLSAVSKFFDAMYSSGMKESKESRVNLKDISPSIFKLILAYVYKGEDILTENNAEELFKTSSMLQIECLQEKCKEFMGRKINPENCLGVWKLARVFNNQGLKNISWSFILKEFENVRHNDEFVGLNVDELELIVKDDDLVVVREESVCDAVLRWINADAEERKASIETLFPHLRLTHVNLDYLLDELDPLSLIQTNDNCAHKLRQAIRLRALPSRRNEQCHLLERHRNYSGKETMLTVIGRRLKESGERNMELIGYSFAQEKWFSLHGTPPDVGDEFASCCQGDDLYITGGTNRLNNCHYYSPVLSRWRSRAKMIQGRYRHSMVAVRNHLYVLGGYDLGTLKSVEEYDIQNDIWKSVGNLHVGVDASSAVAVGCRIYTFGGWLGCAEETAAIQCFDTDTYTCVKVSNLPSPSKFTKAVAVGKRVEILCSEGRLVSFSENGNTKLIGKIPSFNRRNFAMSRDCKGLLIFGGEDNYCSYEKVDQDEESRYQNVYRCIGNEISVCETMKFPTNMEVDGCYHIVIKKEELHTDFEKLLREFDV